MLSFVLTQVRADLPQPVRSLTAFDHEAAQYLQHDPSAAAWSTSSQPAAQLKMQPEHVLGNLDPGWNTTGAPFINSDADFKDLCNGLMTLADRDEKDGLEGVDLEATLHPRRVLSTQAALSLDRVFKTSLLFKP